MSEMTKIYLSIQKLLLSSSLESHMLSLYPVRPVRLWELLGFFAVVVVLIHFHCGSVCFNHGGYFEVFAQFSINTKLWGEKC